MVFELISKICYGRGVLLFILIVSQFLFPYLFVFVEKLLCVGFHDMINIVIMIYRSGLRVWLLTNSWRFLVLNVYFRIPQGEHIEVWSKQIFVLSLLQCPSFIDEVVDWVVIKGIVEIWWNMVITLLVIPEIRTLF